jgi:AmmeMemoRadiSam system protein A
MQPLTTTERRLLLAAARRALEATVAGRPAQPDEPGHLPRRLRTPGASFVTLTKDGRLRGCIGSLYALWPLIDDVRLHAADAATRDVRFQPVGKEELADIRMEISVLSDLQPMQEDHPEALPGRLRPLIDGVVVSGSGRRATFLPQVWERVDDPIVFLEMLCEKAGLPKDAWRSNDLEILTYQVEHFTEGEAADLASREEHTGA